MLFEMMIPGDWYLIMFLGGWNMLKPPRHSKTWIKEKSVGIQVSSGENNGRCVLNPIQWGMGLAKKIKHISELYIYTYNVGPPSYKMVYKPH